MASGIKNTRLWVSYFLQRYRLSKPCLARTTQQHSLEKVKVRPFKYLENNPEAECAFSNLAVDLTSIKEELLDIKKLNCALHGKRNLDSVKNATFEIFLR